MLHYLPGDRELQMEVVLSALLGELATRSMSFFISKSTKPTAPDLADRLCRFLLRSQVIVDEALGRHITNHAMLQQLDLLRDSMHRGYYVIDTFRYQSHDEEDAIYQVMNHSLSLSKINPLKSFWSSTRDTNILEQLHKALDDLSSMILDVEELVRFLTNYPRLYHQPYSMHLLLDNCMFGRQMEAELAIKFLLHTHPHGSRELQVLPIIGPGRVGKSTLVAHVCKDERVRDHFSQILFLRDLDFTDDELATFRKGCGMKHQNQMSNSSRDGRLLIVVELEGDLNGDAWDRLYSAAKQCLSIIGSKIIVTSRSDKIVRYGTTQALFLKYLSHEAYWYFFETRISGSTDPEAHPRLAHLAMEIARMLNGSLIGANVTALQLRDNFDFQLWCKVLTFLRGFVQKQLSSSGVHPDPVELLNQNRPARIGRMAKPSENLVVYRQYQCSSEEEVPNIGMRDVVYGSIKHKGKFEVLAWRSQIPPYHSYVYTCEIQEVKTTAAKRKRSMKMEWHFVNFVIIMRNVGGHLNIS